MQILLLLIMACGFGGAAVAGTQLFLDRPRSRRKNIFLLIAGIGICLAASVLIECILRAGKPTFYYHTHKPGWTTVKIFGTACFFGGNFYALGLMIAERGIQRRSVGQWLARAFLVGICGAISLEIGYFNFRHFELIGAHAPEVSFPSDKIYGGGLFFNRATWRFHPYTHDGDYQFTIYTLNRKIRNITWNYDDGAARSPVRLAFNDRAHREYETIPDHEFIQGIPRSYSIPLHTVGKTYSVLLTLPGSRYKGNSYSISLPEVVINRIVLLEIEPVRFGISFLILFLITAFFPGSPLWDLPLNLHSFPQRTAMAALLCGFFAFFVWTDFSSYSGSDLSITEQKAALNENYQQYNKLVDALMVPSYALPETPHHNLEQIKDVYDRAQRDALNFGYPWDTVYYNGSFYVYFGVVPAVTVLLPYRLLTGKHLELDYPILGFACLFVLGLYGIYRLLVRRFFSGISFGTYWVGLFLLITPLNLTWCLRRTLVYELAIVSGICFAVWGICFMLQAVLSERCAPLWFFLSGLSAALAVGCRPTMLLVSLPVIILAAMEFRARGRFFSRRNFGDCICFLLPYIAVGLALMKYNYERFGDPFEFGITYQLTTENRAAGIPLLGPFGTVLGVLSSLFTLPEFDMNFPFIHLRVPELPYNGMILNTDRILGVFAWPVAGALVLLPFFKKHLREKSRLLIPFFAGCLLAALGICVIASGVAILNRYLTDYMFLIALPAVFALFCLYENCRTSETGKVVQAVFWIAAVIAGCLFAAVSLTGEGDWFRLINLLYYDKLRYALSPWL